MNKQLFKLLFVCSFFAFQSILAQTTITGTVTDASDGTSLPGVNVVEKGTTNGVTTDFDGNYSIEVGEGSILEFSFIGYTTQDIAVNGQSTINVALQESAEVLDEVVVTALGIKREEKTLTYAQQKVDADEITKTKELNFVNSLAGKTSGIQLTKSASGAGGSSRIVLRGNKSIIGVSSPLFVIDGIPMSNETPNAGASSVFSNRDKSDLLSQINPDDIESVTVLKGSNAAILYGSQGANGVIIINTKKGKDGNLSGYISSNLSFEKVMELPDLQYRYGSTGNDENWDATPGNYDNAFIEDFFDTGHTVVNAISLSGGNAKNTSYFSYSNTQAAGVMPGNKYVKHNVTLNQTAKYLNDKLTISGRVMLADEKITNKPMTGYYFNPLTGLYWFPRNLNFNDYKTNYQVLDDSRNILTQNWYIINVDRQQNPYWIINNNKNEDRIKRLITNIGVTYKFNEKLSLQLRGNYDYMPTTFEKRIKAGTTLVLSHENGRWMFNDLKSTQLYTDAIITYTTNINDAISLNAILGSSYEKKEIGKGINVDSSNQFGLKYANEFNFNNLGKEVQVTNQLASRSIKQGLFGNVQLGYKEMLFLDVSGRNDWASTLAFTDNYSYFYPSFGLTAIVDKMVDLPKAIDLAKIRTSYSVIANEVPAFITNPLSTIGRNGIDANTIVPFREMKPEKQKSLEIGLDLRLLGNRLGLDFTYYKIDTEDQFIDLTAPVGSGFTTFYVNAGHIRNSGIEATLNTVPLRTEDLEWKSSLNYTYNKNKILKLHEELNGKYELNNTDGYAIFVTEGGSFGDIYVNKFARDEQGRILIDDNGTPVRTGQREYVGNAQPKFLLGWNNNIAYKNLSLSFLIDGKFGGKAVSLTEAMLDFTGSSQATALARDAGGVSVNGVDANGNAVSSINPETYYKAVGGRDGIVENYVYSATNVRLRQLALAYDFDLNGKNMFFKNVTASFIANNLFFFYKDAPFDPDLSMSTGNRLQSVELFTVPTTRTYGLNLKFNF